MATKIRGICLNFSSDLISRSHYKGRNHEGTAVVTYLGLNSCERYGVCFTEADNDALSLPVGELPEVLMLIASALIPYLNLDALTPNIGLEGIMIENGWDVLHNELIGSVALQ